MSTPLLRDFLDIYRLGVYCQEEWGEEGVGFPLDKCETLPPQVYTSHLDKLSSKVGTKTYLYLGKDGCHVVSH